MDSSTTHVQQVSGGRPPEGGLVAEVSADDNEVLSEEQEVERKSGTMRGCDVIPASILKSTTSYIQYICGQNGTKLKHSLLASDCHLKEKVLYRYTDNCQLAQQLYKEVCRHWTTVITSSLHHCKSFKNSNTVGKKVQKHKLKPKGRRAPVPLHTQRDTCLPVVQQYHLLFRAGITNAMHRRFTTLCSSTTYTQPTHIHTLRFTQHKASCTQGTHTHTPGITAH